jgi:hypothetical protein
MKDGDVKQFIEDIHYEDCCVLYHDRKYFFNGCCHHINAIGKREYRFELYLINDDGSADDTDYSAIGSTAQECIEKFLTARLFEGKTFYEVEKEITWIDC